MNLFLHAWSANLQKVTVSDGERDALQQRGIAGDCFQRFLVWRRSMYLMVIVFSLLSAGLVLVGNQEEGAHDDEETLAALLEGVGVPESLVEGEDSIVERIAGAGEPTQFAAFAGWVHLLALFALPLAAFVAFVGWSRPRLSHRAMLLGWLFAFLVPMAFAFAPWGWWEAGDPPEKWEQWEFIAVGLYEGTTYFVALLPTVLSLVPGVQRACLRVKTLVPLALLPGWFLVSAATFYSLLLLIVVVVLNQLITHGLFVAGMLLFLAAPLVYVACTTVLTRPLLTDTDVRQLTRVQFGVTALTLLAAGCLAAFFVNQKVFGLWLVGLDAQTSFLLPWDLAGYLVEFLSRSFFMTALGADVVLWMNWSVWQHTSALGTTPQATEYDATMSDMSPLFAPTN